MESECSALVRVPNKRVGILAGTGTPVTDPQKENTCTPLQIQRYRSKVSGPLLDRIDIQIEVPTLRYQELAGKEAGEPSAAIRQRVNGARTIRLQRFHK